MVVPRGHEGTKSPIRDCPTCPPPTSEGKNGKNSVILGISPPPAFYPLNAPHEKKMLPPLDMVSLENNYIHVTASNVDIGWNTQIEFK